MLHLKRYKGESVVIGNTTVTVLRFEGVRTGRPRVHLGIEAPGDVRVVRAELLPPRRGDGARRQAGELMGRALPQLVPAGHDVSHRGAVPAGPFLSCVAGRILP